MLCPWKTETAVKGCSRKVVPLDRRTCVIVPLRVFSVRCQPGAFAYWSVAVSGPVQISTVFAHQV